MCITEAAKNMIPKLKKSEIVNRFKKEGYKERTIYNTIERMEDEGSLKDNLRTGRPPVAQKTENSSIRFFIG